MSFRQRIREAAIGAAITLAPVLLVGALQWINASKLLDMDLGPYAPASLEEISQFRSGLVQFYLAAALVLIVHWSLVLSLGRSIVLHHRPANLFLGAAALIFLAICSSAGFVDWYEILISSCPLVGIEAFRLNGGWPHPCHIFATRVLVTGIVVLPALLVIVSLTIRIWAGRSRSAKAPTVPDMPPES